MMTYIPEHLELWKRPDCYAGADWPDCYVFLGQHRDSDSLTRSNFICGLRDIGGESETVLTVCEGHWAVGWIEWIAIHESDAEALRKADKIKAALDDYPVVDESHWSDLEYDEASTYWQQMSVRERAEYLYRAGISLFAARRDYIPADDCGRLYELLRGV